MKKTCYNCGKKVEKIKEGLCYDCFSKINPPLEDIKPINIKFCNGCKKLFFQNKYLEFDDFKKILEKNIEKYIKLNREYILKEVKIENLEYDKGKVSFDVTVETDIKE